MGAGRVIAGGGVVLGIGWLLSRILGTTTTDGPSPTPTPTPDPVDPPPAPPVGTGPAWPLATKSRTLTTDFGDARPFGSKHPTRHHVGEDLRAPRGTVVFAPEDGTIVRVLPTWYKSPGGGCVAGALLLEVADFVLNLGEVEGWEAFGIAEGVHVKRGQQVARVGCTGMLHFEVYARGTRATKRWWWGQPMPSGMFDPTTYLVAAGGVVKG